MKTLLLANNCFTSSNDLKGLLECPSITCLDLQKNKIEDGSIVDILIKMPKLAVLYLQGNPCVRKIKNYRKFLIARIPTLKYLDDRPVFPEDRERAEVYVFFIYLLDEKY